MRPEFMDVEFRPDETGSQDDGVGSLSNMGYHSNGGGITYRGRPGSLRGDGYGGGGKGGYHALSSTVSHIQSHNYEPDESEVWRAYVAQVHFSNRGQWWTTGKKRSLKRWILTFMVGVIQALVAASCNFFSRLLSKHKYDYIYDLLNPNVGDGSLEEMDLDDDLVDEVANNDKTSSGGGPDVSAFWAFCLIQVIFAAIASMFVWIEPVSGGSGIPGENTK